MYRGARAERLRDVQPTGSVIFNRTTGQAVAADGGALWRWTFPASAQTVSAIYNGDGNYQASAQASCSGANRVVQDSARGGGGEPYVRGAEEYLRQNGVPVDVVQDAECIRMMTELFRDNAALWNEDIGE
jgi:hypothetical protein